MSTAGYDPKSKNKQRLRSDCCRGKEKRKVNAAPQSCPPAYTPFKPAALCPLQRPPSREKPKRGSVGWGEETGRKVGPHTPQTKADPSQAYWPAKPPPPPAAGSLTGLSASSSIQAEFPPSVLNAAAVTFLPSQAKKQEPGHFDEGRPECGAGDSGE